MKIRILFAVMITVLLIGAVVNSNVGLFYLARNHADARIVQHLEKVGGDSRLMLQAELQGTQTHPSLEDAIEKSINGLVEGSAELNLPKAGDSEFAATLKRLRDSWNSLQADIDRSRTDETARESMEDAINRFMREADQALAIAERNAASNVTAAYIVQTLQTAISIAALLLVAFIIYVNRRIAAKLASLISTLAETAAQLASTLLTHQRIASEQATATNETTTTIEHVGESSRLSASQAENSSSETRQALALAEDGSRVVQQTLGSMRDLKTNVANLAREIMFLSERLDQIAEISTFVGDLANQTNMLALNAAVEAAHAGEQGKGFAVVATEIRKLADQSTKSVSRINDLVTDIQQATNSAVMVTDQGTKSVEHGMSLAEGTTQVFKNLVSSINRGAESVQQISLNAKQQASAINQIVEAIELLNTSAKEAAQGLRQTNHDLETLNRVVIDLQAMVGANHDHRR